MNLEDLATKQDLEEVKQLILSQQRQNIGPVNYSKKEAMTVLNIKETVFKRLEHEGVIKCGFYDHCNKKLYPKTHIDALAHSIGDKIKNSGDLFQDLA